MTAQAPEARSEKRDGILAKVRKIMDLADGTDVQGEKDAAMAQAAALMARYAIEQHEIEAVRKQGEPEKIIDYSFVVGPRKSPVSKWRAQLAMHVALTHRCRMYQSSCWNYDRGAEDYEVHIIGFESDVAFVEMLYTSLALQMDAEHDVAKADKRDWVNGRTFRTNFNAGFAEEAQLRLSEIARQTAEAIREDDVTKQATLPSATSGALVLRERTQAVNDWVNENLNLRTTRSYGRSKHDGHARQAGRAAAGRADYSGGRTARIGARGQIGR